jgi:Fe2+ or Zn2+ uptake regulation protein
MSELTSLAARLKRAGYKPTDPRLAVIEVLEREDNYNVSKK